MNDMAVSDYARIEETQALTVHKKGHLLLPYRGHLTEAQKIMDNLTDHIFTLKHNKVAALRKYGEIVKWDYECQLRYLLAVYNLTVKAEGREPPCRF